MTVYYTLTKKGEDSQFLSIDIPADDTADAIATAKAILCDEYLSTKHQDGEFVATQEGDDITVKFHIFGRGLEAVAVLSGFYVKEDLIND